MFIVIVINIFISNNNKDNSEATNESGRDNDVQTLTSFALESGNGMFKNQLVLSASGTPIKSLSQDISHALSLLFLSRAFDVLVSLVL